MLTKQYVLILYYLSYMQNNVKVIRTSFQHKKDFISLIEIGDHIPTHTYLIFWYKHFTLLSYLPYFS